MKRTMILTLVLAIVLMGMGAYAMPIKVSNGTFTATATDTADGSEYALDVEEFQLLGKDADGAYLVYSDGHFLTVSAGFMQPVLDAIGGDASLPVIADMQTLSRGSRGEGVETLQRALIRLGYMSGSADGDFGGMSERAVSAAQEALGEHAYPGRRGQLQLTGMESSGVTGELVVYAKRGNKLEQVYTDLALRAILPILSEFTYTYEVKLENAPASLLPSPGKE